MDGDKVVGSSLIALQGFLRGRFIDIRGTGIIYIYAPVFQNPANRQSQSQHIIFFLPALVYCAGVSAAVACV